MGSRKQLQIALAALLVFHVVIALADFFAPYASDAQNRLLALAPPSHIRFVDALEHYHLRPFIYRLAPRPGGYNEYQEDRTTALSIRFFVKGSPYRLLGILPSRRHLFGLEGQTPLFLLGSDTFGRDEFSRLIHGGRTSLFIGLLATAISLSIGTAFGGIAGYYGNWIDAITMRITEIFLTVPWLYLLLFVRAFLPSEINANQAFLLLIVILGVLGWARPARLVRGVVLSAREREYVLAAKAFGASDFYLLRRHILPQASGVVVAQAALYIPQYILAEVTLSFFGLGISEPAPSWGNMLAGLQNFFVLESCWWMFSPAAALVGVILGYHWLFSRYASHIPRI